MSVGDVKISIIIKAASPIILIIAMIRPYFMALLYHITYGLSSFSRSSPKIMERRRKAIRHFLTNYWPEPLPAILFDRFTQGEALSL